ncbi:hypothetical protein FA95DRAFT_212060 [Auriscalpium vulgare]|uniref:Uncharacterized protein n=1 Tax=Auriscalpium vulgare TaxID=40419 RepID=A0ACB8RLQ6_9AGAM|nr:hypothetical protein FA95DRAFT_212060 [Auriscalpium vulgare]
MSDAAPGTPIIAIPATGQSAVLYTGDWNLDQMPPFTETPNANVSVSFEGTTFRAIGFWNAPSKQSFMNVTMDGKDPEIKSVHVSVGNTPIMLFESDELPCGSHTTTLTLTRPNTTMSIEGFSYTPCVFAAEPSGSASTIISSSSHSHIGLIVGVAVGAVVGLLLLLGLLFMRRRQHLRKERTKAKISEFSVTPPETPTPPALQLLRSTLRTRVTSSLIPFVDLSSTEPLDRGHVTLAIDTALPLSAAPELPTSPQSSVAPSYHTSRTEAPPYTAVPPDVPSLP